MSKLTRMSRRTANSALLWTLAGCATKPEMPSNTASATPAPAPAVTEAPPAAAAAPTPPPVAPAPPPPPILSFADAVSNATYAVFKQAPQPDAAPAMIVIDPLVDGLTGYTSSATKNIATLITGFAESSFSQYKVQKITADKLKQQPRFLIGTFTPINADLKPAGKRESYWFCLVMGDLKTGKIIAKSVARAKMSDDDIDTTPSATFRDSPVWTNDPSIQAYVATCKQSKVGDPIRPEYLDGLLAAALINEATDAYNEGKYSESLDLFRTALKSNAGQQLRVYNGIYLSLLKLGRNEESAKAFGDAVQYGLEKRRLAVKFLFRPGSVRFADDKTFNGNYDMWIDQIAQRAAATNTCLQISGHTSPTGTAALNDRLSLLRAEYIQSRLEEDSGQLKDKTLAVGKGSRENLIGTGKDDMSDMLDRRVELNPIDKCTEGAA
jgi:outer membrane protein OmpA-like peptidoglycan-associated protein